jgi:putative addiction module component (TIGR02574 family)
VTASGRTQTDSRFGPSPASIRLLKFSVETLENSNHRYGCIEMAASAKTVLDQALELPANDRAALVDTLISSLDKPDQTVDAKWIKEAEDRLAAYRSGELRAVDAEHVFAELGRQI